MGYIQELRELIGNMPIVLVGATLVVYDDQNRILLQHRADTGTWGFPGGATEPGECIEEAGKRELYEETGLEAEDLKLLGVFSGPEFFFEYPNGDQTFTVIVLYEAINVTGTLRVNDAESLGLAYFPLDDLPELVATAKKIIGRLATPGSKRLRATYE